ncbi:hypothetical protein BK010_04395 [Tenericutes bacterium MO-XQ]|nr:hypothetical protein BK010_04395 [Tenericutes bacterium MO-XQ]
MNILVAMNAFKGTLSSVDVNEIVKNHFESLNHEVLSIPISDGGDGFLDAISKGLEGNFVEVEVFDPLNRTIKEKIFMIKDKAYIELAKVSGLNLLSKEEQNPLNTSTYGLGIMIKQAIYIGAKHIYIGAGGSATHDCGIGMLQALGVRFYHHGKLIDEKLCGKHLSLITSFDLSHLEDLIEYIDFEVITDVKNTLLGDQGAAHIYAKQKGASKEDITFLEKATKHFADIVEEYKNENFRDNDGSGAAGGIGFGFLSFLDATLHSGIEFMIDLLHIEEAIKKVDLIIVGEGKLDQQTIYGKAPYGIAKIAKKHQKKVIGIFGIKDDLKDNDFLDETYVIVPKYASNDLSMNHPKQALLNMLKKVFTS